MAKKKNILESLNIDGKSCCMFSTMDNNPDNVLFNIFHIDVMDNIEIRGLENIVSIANFLLQCYTEYSNDNPNEKQKSINTQPIKKIAKLTEVK